LNVLLWIENNTAKLNNKFKTFAKENMENTQFFWSEKKVKFLQQKFLFTLVSFGLILWASASCYAAPGDLDTTFGIGGKVNTDIVTGATIYSIAIQSDGKIIAAGRTDQGGGIGFSLVRYNTDGSVDTTFDTGGKVVTSFGANVTINSIAIQPDGKIVVAGFGAPAFGSPTKYDFLLARFNAAGSLDATFGDGGKVFTDFNNLENFVNSIAIQPSGKIVVAGENAVGAFAGVDSDFALARYNADGTLDNTFGNGGKVLTDFAGGVAHTLLSQPDGKIIAAGFEFTNPSTDRIAYFAIVRYNIDGSLDISFGTNGKVLTPVGNFNRQEIKLGAAALQPDGKIVVTGKGYDETSNIAFVVHRYNTNGTLDNAFGNGGKVTTRFGEGLDSRAYAVAIQSNGKIIVAGAYRGPENNYYDFALARYNPNGTLDTSFGTNGKILTDFEGRGDLAYTIALQSDGKIIAAGRSFTFPFDLSRFALARYLGGPFNLLQTPATFIVSDSTGNNNGFPEPGENLTLTVPLSNNTGFDATGTTLQVAGGSSANYGTISDISTLSRQVSYTVPANTHCGSILTLTINVNSSLGTTSFTRQIIIGTPITTLSENFDGINAPALPAGWTATTIQNGINFVTTTTNPDTAPNSMVALDPETVGGGTDLTSPSISITAPAAILSFRNRYDTEAHWDGGVLEISIGSSAFQDILTAGGSFIEGGYNDTLGANGANNPLAGRRAWSGNSNGYLTTTVQLPASAVGQNVRFRWRFGADDNTGGPGWNIDTVKVVGSYSCSMIITQRTAFDFDADGKADISVYRPNSGTWYSLNSNTGFASMQFGLPTDKIVPADYDGDGKTDFAVFRNGTWYLQRSQAGFTSIQFGAPDDIPLPSDYDADGRADLAVYRQTNGTWYVLNATTGQYTSQQWGVSTDKPVVADYDGDGKADYAVYRPSNGTWYLMRSQDGFKSVQWGESTDKPVIGDYDGDGKADQVVYRPSNGTWYLLRSRDGFSSAQWGESTDLPVSADYDGDGKTDVAVYRPSSGYWYLLKSKDGFAGIQFGEPADRPIPNAFIP
jgi:uncharacterized delta-60 repeat protein